MPTFAAERQRQNTTRARVVLAVAFVVHVAIFLVFRHLPDDPSSTVMLWRHNSIQMHQLLAGISSLSLLLLAVRRFEPLRPWAIRVVMVVYLVFGAALASNDQLVTAAISPFLITTIGLTVLFRVDVLEGALLQSLGFATFCVGMQGQLVDSARLSNITNGFAMCALSVASVAVLSKLERRAFEQRSTINAQRAELAVALVESRLLADRAEAANRAKSTFLATMSHEIRTPLNGMMGSAELLALSSLNSEQGELLRNLSDAGDLLLRLLNDLLDFSKIEAGKLELERVPFDVRSLLTDVVSLFAPAARARGLALDLRVDSQVPQWLVGDPIRLRQVLSNLISNAIKFTQKGAVKVSATSLGSEPSNGRLRLEVTDTGIGMSTEEQARLFQPFVQAESSTTRRFGGTGLGLAISKRLVEAFDATLVLRSEVGHGSTFAFDASWPVGQRPTELGAPQQSNGLLRGRVLVAEDNDINALVTTRMLESLGLTVVRARDGAEALVLWHSDPYQLVLSDLHMPTVDGYGLAFGIRASEQGKRTPIVVLTADALPEDRVRCLEAGIDEVMYKPFRRTELESMLHRWLPQDATEPGVTSHSSPASPPPPHLPLGRNTH